jgi:hypothetical protein
MNPKGMPPPPSEVAWQAINRATSAWKPYYNKHLPFGYVGLDDQAAFSEADARIGLAAFIFQRILASHQVMEQTDDPLVTANIMAFEMRVDTESLYWQTARLSRLLRNLPGLRRFDPPGVRDVRNHLIEHPEGRSSRVLMWSLHWSRDRGPGLKTSRALGTSEAFPDAGLFANTTEFFLNLYSLLTEATGP